MIGLSAVRVHFEFHGWSASQEHRGWISTERVYPPESLGDKVTQKINTLTLSSTTLNTRFPTLYLNIPLWSVRCFEVACTARTLMYKVLPQMQPASHPYHDIETLLGSLLNRHLMMILVRQKCLFAPSGY